MGFKASARNTALSYASAARQYLTFYQERIDEQNTRLSISAQNIQQYVAYCREQGKKESTIETQIHGILAFWDFLHQQGLTPNEPVPFTKLNIRVKPKLNPVPPLSKEEERPIMQEVYDELNTMW